MRSDAFLVEAVAGSVVRLGRTVQLVADRTSHSASKGSSLLVPLHVFRVVVFQQLLVLAMLVELSIVMLLLLLEQSIVMQG